MSQLTLNTLQLGITAFADVQDARPTLFLAPAPEPAHWPLQGRAAFGLGFCFLICTM